jgi:tetratricopeptide (TPR) repeat protein
MRAYALSLAFVMVSLPAFAAESAAVSPQQQQAALTSPEERAALHNSPDWQLIAPHLPDPATATAAQLETAGDVLRARRFPEDALDYYGYALARGGDVSELLNKMGIVRLELHQTDLARALFLRTVRARKKDASAWNNLGVADYSAQEYHAAVSEYRRACKLNKRSAVFHSNLALAYFELGDVEEAREEFAQALRIDPSIMRSADGGGTTAHVIGSHNYPGLCLEMAKLYAEQHDLNGMLFWLAKGSDAGLDLRGAIRDNVQLSAYAKDPQVLLLVTNQQELHARTVAASKPPSLGTSH